MNRTKSVSEQKHVSINTPAGHNNSTRFKKTCHYRDINLAAFMVTILCTVLADKVRVILVE